LGCLPFFFFFQAEDGIRDFHVTGVQTCALPIWMTSFKDNIGALGAWLREMKVQPIDIDYILVASPEQKIPKADAGFFGKFWHERSEERRVGQERRSVWARPADGRRTRCRSRAAA